MNWSTKAIVALICVLAAVTILATDASGENREVIIDESGTYYIQPFLYYSGTATGVPEGTAILVDLGDNGSLSRAFTKTDADGRFSDIIRLNNVEDGQYSLRIKATPEGQESFSKTTIVNIATIEGFKPVSGATISKTELELMEGEMSSLDVTISPADATNKSVIWFSSNPGVASVRDGRVVAQSAGTATITAKTSSSNVEASCTVTVRDLRIGLSSPGLTIQYGESTPGSAQLAITGLPASGEYRIDWSSNQPSVASIV